MHALIIEDQFLIAALIEDELRDLGYTSFRTVDRQSDAVEAARIRCPDLITADDRLTEGSGIEAVRLICQGASIPVVFIVGDPEAFVAPIPDAVLIGKPFGGRRLEEAVAEAVQLQQLERLV